MKSPRRNAAGFSLVELLMAGVVVASAGSLLAGGLMTANRGAQLRRQQILMTQALASQFAQLDDRVVDASGETSGTLLPPLETMRWTRHWEPVSEELARIRLTVSDGASIADVVTYRPIKAPE
jgi:type II secretory pathway pseudopilin PulG